MPNIEYMAPWFRSDILMRCMPYERWLELSPHAQRICRYVMCDEGEKVIGAGYMNPRAKMREAFKEEELSKMSAEERAHYLHRL